mgnify:CR=1 FL=1
MFACSLNSAFVRSFHVLNVLFTVSSNLDIAFSSLLRRISIQSKTCLLSDLLSLSLSDEPLTLVFTLPL